MISNEKPKYDDPESIKNLYEELLDDTAAHMDGSDNVREVAMLRAIREIVADTVRSA